MLRTQVRCVLVVRLAWDVADGEHHPPYTYTCAEDLEMAVTAVSFASASVPRGIRLIGAAVSATAGRFGPWEPLDLGASA